MPAKKNEPNSPEPRKRTTRKKPKTESIAGETAPAPKAGKPKAPAKPRTTTPKTAAPKRSRKAVIPPPPPPEPRTPDSAQPTADSAPRTRLRASRYGGQAADRALRILMVTPEAHPFAKTGGLAEVTAALPAALARLGHSVTLVLPRYRGVLPGAAPSKRVELRFGPNAFSVGFVEQAMDDGVRAVLVDVPELFDRAGLYGENGRDFPDNALRFAVLSRAALEFARLENERPDIIHAHDWQTGLVPVYQKMQLADDPVVGGVPVVFTIHNLAFQGVFGRDALPAIGLDWNVFHPDALEYWGNISLLKGGVNFSERITTVSPTYAREILAPQFGFGFEGVLRRRADDLAGILNGIDITRWDPEADAFAPHFSATDLSGKREAKRALLEQAGLPADDAALDRPLVGLISRLTDQKGFDLIGAAAPQLIEFDAAWVMLGSGERHYEDQWRSLAAHYPDRVSATIGFDERLAHMIEAGADMFLMPSRFEPCGLNQLYSLRYGTVPIVRATGGLEDTVRDAAEPGGNGIKFADPVPGALVAAVRRALQLYRDKDRWTALRKAGMAADPSWDVSAREYVKVYGGVRTDAEALKVT